MKNFAKIFGEEQAADAQGGAAHRNTRCSHQNTAPDTTPQVYTRAPDGATTSAYAIRNAISYERG